MPFPRLNFSETPTLPLPSLLFPPFAVGYTQSILIPSVRWHAGQEIGATWVTISARPCTVLPGFPLTPGWVNPQAKVPQGCMCSDTSHLFPRACPRPCPQHSSRQHAYAGAPRSLQPALSQIHPRLLWLADGLVHDGLFLLVLDAAGAGCDCPGAVPDLLPHRLLCSPRYPKLPVTSNTWMYPACLFWKVQLPPACHVVTQWHLSPPKFGIRAVIIGMQVVSIIK